MKKVKRGARPSEKRSFLYELRKQQTHTRYKLVLIRHTPCLLSGRRHH